MYKPMRRRSARVIVVSVIFLTVLACIYYTSYTNTVGPTQSSSATNAGAGSGGVNGGAGSDENLNLKLSRSKNHNNGLREALFRSFRSGDYAEDDSSTDTNNYCPKLDSAKANVDTVETFKTFEFQVRTCVRSFVRTFFLLLLLIRDSAAGSISFE